MPCQCLQVQDGLGSLGLQYTDGLEQPLITNVEDRGEGRAEMLYTLLTADAMHLTIKLSAVIHYLNLVQHNHTLY